MNAEGPGPATIESEFLCPQVAKTGLSTMCESSHHKRRAPTAEAHRIRFRLLHVLYAVTVLGSSIATFGLVGIIPAYFILRLWAMVFKIFRQPNRFPLVCLGYFLVLCLLVATLLVSPLLDGSVDRTQCNANLKTLAYALQMYHDTYKTFPPAYLSNEDGKPVHSWRVLILPFFEGRSLYEAYDFDEPWDGPNNRKLLERAPHVFACPAQRRTSRQPSTHTSYLAVVGPRTAWLGGNPTRIQDFTDGTSKTILIMESDGRGVPWMEPRDLSLDEALDLVTSDEFDHLGGHGLDRFFTETHDGRLAATADGGVEFLPHGTPKQKWAALLTIDDGKDVDCHSIDYPVRTLKRPNIWNWYRLSLFVVSVLLPLPWVWISRGRAAKRSIEAQAAEPRS